MYLNEKHLKHIVEVEQGPVGHKPQSWLRSVFGENNEMLKMFLMAEQFSRSSLNHFVYETQDNLTAASAILIWGGMNRQHARKLFEDSNRQYILSIVEKLRNNEYKTRQDAFKAFHTERLNGHLPGLGIAYYTKLICFLNPELKGYIMDQWTAKSINFLYNDNSITHLIWENGNSSSKKGWKTAWVSDKNDADNYESFCSRLEYLAKELNCSPLTAEERIFSKGGVRPGSWRKYLNMNYKPSL